MGKVAVKSVLTMAFVSRLNTLTRVLQPVVRRNLATSTKLADPVQNLFLSKLNEYKAVSADLPEGELHETLPEIEEEKKFMVDNINKRFGPGMEEVPVFSWESYGLVVSCWAIMGSLFNNFL